MGGELAADAEVLGRADDAEAEVLLPDAVDQRPARSAGVGRKRATSRDPRRLRGNSVDIGGSTAGVRGVHVLAAVLVQAADEDVRLPRLLQLLHDERLGHLPLEIASPRP